MRTVLRTTRVALLLTAFAGAAALPSVAAAKPATEKSESSAKKKIVVGAFDGPKSGEVRDSVVEALKSNDDYDVTSNEDVKPGAKDSEVAEAAKSAGAAAVVTGTVKKGFTLVLSVRNGSDGALIEDVNVKGGALPKLKTNIDKTLVEDVAGPLGQAKGEETKPEADEAKPDAEEPKAEAEAEVSADTDSAPSDRLSPLDVTAGLRAYHRTFEFNQTIADVRPNEGFQPLLRYELPLGPAVFIDLNWYPLAHFMAGPAGWAGITAGYEKGFATESVYAENQPGEKTLKTDMQSWYVGLRGRFPLGVHQIGASATYGKHQFTLLGDENPPLIPDVTYTFIRLGVDAELHFGDFLVGARLGKRLVSDTGPLKTVWFKNTKAQSLEAGLSVGYRLSSMLDIVAGFDWLRYAFDFNPVPQRAPGLENFVAGGAVDQYLSGSLGVRFRLPPPSGGSGGGGASAPAAAAAEPSGDSE